MDTPTNPATLAALIGLSLALVKVLEIAITGLVRKVRPPKEQQVTVHLAQETVDRLDQVHAQVGDLHRIMTKTDNDGTPMVYSSRSGTEAVRDTAAIIRQIQIAQEQIIRLIEKMEQRFEQHDLNDQKVQGSLVTALERIARTTDDHDRWSRSQPHGDGG